MMNSENKNGFNSSKFPLTDVNLVSKLLKAYLNKEEIVKPLYKYPLEFDSIEKIISDKKKDKTNRVLLHKVLSVDYKNVDTSKQVLANIDLLKNENTFTVCTAHQLNILTGPLYIIYKIVSAINLCKTLSQKFPDYNFVPVYFLGSEDHDFEEINHLHLFNKKVEWQTAQKGSTGKFNLDGFKNVINEVEEILGKNENTTPLLNKFKEFHTSSDTLGKFAFQLINHLFKAYGLVILEADNTDLKASFSKIIEQELTAQFAFNSSKKEVDFLEEHFKAQAKPRNINLFYVDENGRNRIELENNIYKIVNTNTQFTLSQILEELKNDPQKFSPNVILRPVYQEFILPNLIYVGGGGEIAYWLELKNIFKTVNINFPMLLHRDSAIFISKKDIEKWNNLGFELTDFFKAQDDLSKNFVLKNTSENLEFDLEAIENLKADFLQKAQSIDKSLAAPIEGEFKKINNGLENLQSKFTRSLKRNSETQINQIAKTKAKIYPNQKLQGRYVNFLEIYSKHGTAFFDVLLNSLNQDLESNCWIFEG